MFHYKLVSHWCSDNTWLKNLEYEDQETTGGGRNVHSSDDDGMSPTPTKAQKEVLITSKRKQCEADSVETANETGEKRARVDSATASSQTKQQKTQLDKEKLLELIKALQERKDLKEQLEKHKGAISSKGAELKKILEKEKQSYKK